MSAISAFEAAMQIPALNSKPELARAYGIMNDLCWDCVETLKRTELSEEYAIQIVSATKKKCATIAGKVCESPIEAAALASLVFCDWTPFMTIPAAICQPGEQLPQGDIIICPQFNLGPYRLDFLVIAKSPNGRQKWVNVECDGDEFHNKDKPTWASDRERDKFVTGCGVQVFRFTGAQLWKDATGCVQELISEMSTWLERLENDKG